MKSDDKGFVAMTLVIGVAGILLAFSFMQSVGIGHFFDQTIKKQYRFISYHAAANCIDRAFLEIAHDYFFETHEPIEYEDIDCVISSLSRQGDTILIDAYGIYQGVRVKRSAVGRLYDNRVEVVSIE